MTRRKRVLPGSREALEDLHIAKFRLTIACRLIQSFTKEAIYLVKQCERYGSTSNFNQNINETAAHISLTLQELTRAGKNARRSLKQFQNTTKGV